MRQRMRFVSPVSHSMAQGCKKSTPCQHHSQMGRLASHAQRHNITDLPAAEQMRMTTACETNLAALISILQGKCDTDTVIVRKIRLSAYILQPDLRIDTIPLPHIHDLRRDLARAAHLPVGKIIPQPIHMISVFFKKISLIQSSSYRSNPHHRKGMRRQRYSFPHRAAYLYRRNPAGMFDAVVRLRLFPRQQAAPVGSRLFPWKTLY